MKLNFKLKKRIFIVTAFFLLTACGGGSSSTSSNQQSTNTVSSSNSSTLTSIEYSGVAQKGPFSPESVVTIGQLTSKGQSTNNTFTTKTLGSTSSYSYKLPEDWFIDTQEFPITITVNGSYLNEAEGGVSANDITLNTLLAKPSNTSVNLLTHWSSIRAKVLMFTKGMSVSEALEQSHSELNSITGIDRITDLDISQNISDTDNNSQLLLLSGALLEVVEEYDVSTQQIINQISVDFADDGILNSQGKSWFKRIQAIIRTNPQRSNNQYAQVLNEQLARGDNLVVPSGDLLPSRITIAARPQAIAPKVIFAAPGETVTLDGRESHDNADGGEIINTTWFRIDQQTQFVVPISDRFLANPTIVAPNTDSEILFALIVTNTEKLTDTTVVKVVVRSSVNNQTPVGDSQSVTTNEDTSVDIVLAASDAEGDVISFDVGTTPLLLQHGILNGTAPNLRYTPDKDYFGPDKFTFTASDASSTSEKKIVDITVLPVNDKPVADPKTITTDEDTSESVVLTGSDIEDDPLVFSIETTPTNGSLDTSALPTVIYTPDSGFNGTDEFTYKADDGQDLSDLAKVDIIVLPVNGKPLAISQTVVTNQDAPKSILLNGVDPEDGPLTFSVETQPEHGELVGTAPDLLYIPDVGYSGLDSFTFKVKDEDDLESDTAAKVAITVIPVNNNKQPEADDQSATTPKNKPINITLMGSDPDGDSLNFVTVFGPLGSLSPPTPENGTLSGSGANRTYTPNPGFIGTDFFFFMVDDGQLASDLAMVDITVTNTRPVAVADSVPVTTVPSATLINLIGSDSFDDDDDPLTYQWEQTAGPSVAVFVQTVMNTSVTAPNVTEPTDITFSLVVNDGTENSIADTVTLEITPVNHDPIAKAGNDQTLVLPTGSGGSDASGVSASSGVAEVDLDGSGSEDPDGDDLTFLWETTPPSSSVTIDDPTSETPKLTITDHGVYVIKLTVTDDGGLTDTDTVEITVQARPTAPDLFITVDATLDAVNPPTPIQLGGDDPDGENTELIYTILSAPENGSLEPGIGEVADGETSYSPEHEEGTFLPGGSFTYKVTDEQGLDSPIATVFLNLKPIAFAFVKTTPVDWRYESGEGEFDGIFIADIALQGSVSYDPEDGNITSYEWTLENITAGALTVTTPDNVPAGLDPTYTITTLDGPYFDDVVLVFKLVVIDSKGESSEDTVTVTVARIPSS